MRPRLQCTHIQTCGLTGALCDLCLNIRVGIELLFSPVASWQLSVDQYPMALSFLITPTYSETVN